MEKNIPATIQLRSAHGRKDCRLGEISGVGEDGEYGSLGKIHHHDGKEVVGMGLGVQYPESKGLKATDIARLHGERMVRFCR